MPVNSIPCMGVEPWSLACPTPLPLGYFLVLDLKDPRVSIQTRCLFTLVVRSTKGLWGEVAPTRVYIDGLTKICGKILGQGLTCPSVAIINSTLISLSHDSQFDSLFRIRTLVPPCWNLDGPGGNYGMISICPGGDIGRYAGGQGQG